MEYNELITRARRLYVSAPDTDVILRGMRHRMKRRQQRRQWVVSMALVVLMGASTAFLLQPTATQPRLTLAESVSRQLDKPRSNMPAPLVGYRNSIRNHQIYTLI